MTLVLIVWLIMTVLPALKAIGFVAVVSAVVGLFVTSVIYSETEDRSWLDWTIKQLKWCVLLVLVAALTPNKETTWYMVGAYGTQKIIESPVAQDIASDGVDVLKSLMRKAKEHIDEIDAKETPKASESKK